MPIAKEFHVENEAQMPQIAAKIAPLMTPGAILALDGDLGAGKTTLARALIRILADDPVLDVPSPTFTLVQTYETPRGPLWHFDFYRLKSPDEIYELGWEDALAQKAMLVMEWGERIGPFMPAGAIRAIITPHGAGRKIEVRV